MDWWKSRLIILPFLKPVSLVSLPAIFEAFSDAARVDAALNLEETSGWPPAPSPFPGARYFILRRETTSEIPYPFSSISLPHTTTTPTFSILTTSQTDLWFPPQLSQQWQLSRTDMLHSNPCTHAATLVSTVSHRRLSVSS